MINERRLTSGHRCPMMDGRRSRSLIISYFAIRTIIHPRYLQPVTDKSSVIIPRSQHVCVRERKGIGRRGGRGARQRGAEGREKEENYGCTLRSSSLVYRIVKLLSSFKRKRRTKEENCASTDRFTISVRANVIRIDHWK